MVPPAIFADGTIGFSMGPPADVMGPPAIGFLAQGGPLHWAELSAPRSNVKAKAFGVQLFAASPFGVIEDEGWDHRP